MGDDAPNDDFVYISEGQGQSKSIKDRAVSWVKEHPYMAGGIAAKPTTKATVAPKPAEQTTAETINPAINATTPAVKFGANTTVAVTAKPTTAERAGTGIIVTCLSLRCR